MIGQSLMRSRRAVAIIFFVNGFLLASWVPHIPMVKQRLGIGEATLGIVLLAMAIGAVAALSVAGRLVERFGSRTMTLAAALGLCCTVVLPVAAGTTALVALTLLLLGACNGSLDVAMNAQAVIVERRFGRSIMSSFHAFFSLGGLCGAGCAGLLVWAGVAPLSHVLLATACGCVAIIRSMPFLIEERTSESRSPAGEQTLARRSRRLRRIGLLAFAALLAEGAMADWTAVYLHDVLGSEPALAAAGFAACSMMMAIGRFMGDRTIGTFGPVNVLRGSGTSAAIGLALALATGTPLAAIVGCGMVGAGIANAIPILFSRAGNISGVDPATALATVAATGYLGFLAGPPAIGVIAELTTLRIALGVVVVCCALIAFNAGVAATESRAR